MSRTDQAISPPSTTRLGCPRASAAHAPDYDDLVVTVAIDVTGHQQHPLSRGARMEALAPYWRGLFAGMASTCMQGGGRSSSCLDSLAGKTSAQLTLSYAPSPDSWKRMISCSDLRERGFPGEVAG